MWKFCKCVSRAYGMKNLWIVEPWEKMQGFLSNTSLAEMHRPCVCTVKHSHVQGTIKGGPRHGERCSTVAGEYTPAMCSALATIVQRVVRGQWQPFLRANTWSCRHVFAAAPNLAGIGRELQAHCAGIQLCRHKQGVAGVLAAAPASIHEAAPNLCRH